MPKWSLNFPGNNTLKKSDIQAESRDPPDNRGAHLQEAGAELPVGLASVHLLSVPLIHTGKS